MMENQTIGTTPVYASFWKRFHAYGYDVLLVQLATLGVMFLFFTFPTLEQILQLGPELANWTQTFTNIAIAISGAYNIGCVSSQWQATLGKRFCGIKVINADGARLTLIQSAFRHLASGIGGLLGGLPFLTVCITQEKCAPHDMICNTRVVRV